MTYKEKKLKDFEEFCLDKGVLFTDRKMMAGFLYETIDEILGCLPEEWYSSFPETEEEIGYDEGFNDFRKMFLQNLEKKAGEV